MRQLHNPADFTRVSRHYSLDGRHLDLHLFAEFELGLELDSAEVRGVLIHEGQDWGRVVFDFRT